METTEAMTKNPLDSAEQAKSNAPVGKKSTNAKLMLLGFALAVLICLGWTIWLIILSVSPQYTINFIMKTADFDYGSFWLLSDASPVVVGVGVAGLTGVVCGYVALLVKTARLVSATGQKQYRAKSGDGIARLQAKVANAFKPLEKEQLAKDMATKTESLRQLSRSFKRGASSIALEVLDHESATRRNILLDGGMPIGLIGIFAATVSLNAFVSGIFLLQSYDNCGRAQTLLDTLFDFIVSVGFPLIVLAFSLCSFTFDRPVFAINEETFPPGFFETYAAAIADPVEVTTIHHALDSLRIDSVLKIFTRVGTNLALCRRCFGLFELLVKKRAGFATHPNVYPKKHRLFSAIFFFLTVAIVVGTEESVRTSSAACAPFPECIQIARRWIWRHDDPQHCPCRTVIDRNITIATYAEWMQPINLTDKIAQLAASGDLTTIELVNRAFEIPPELRRCKGLKHLSLYYTHTHNLPDWFEEFTSLEFLHIEGKSMSESLQSLPDSVFDHMPSLKFIHLAVHSLPKLPSFKGLVGLQSLALAVLPAVTSLPNFNSMHKLERLVIAANPSLETIPDLTGLRHLHSLTASDRGQFCCNGFLGPDRCNLSHSLCRFSALWGAPALTQCLPADRVATPATRAYFDKFKTTACYGEALKPGELKLAPTPEEMVQCNGTMYRACIVPGYNGSAMCYNARWMAVACDPSPFAIEMRRKQIAQGVGEPCNKDYEAWLGC